MTRDKFVTKLRELFDGDFRDKVKRGADIAQIRKALKNKKRQLKQQLEDCKDPDQREALEKQIEVVKKQQNKAIKLQKKEKD